MNKNVKPFNFPTIFVIFGATGDLMTKKIVPSLFHLFLHNKLPDHLRVIGFARRGFTDAAFREQVKSILEKSGQKIRAKDKKFFDYFTYHQGNFSDHDSFVSLKKTFDAIESDWGVCTNKLFFLAVSPDFYKNIFSSLGSVGLNKPCSDALGWSRILVEKPFGKDYKTSRELNTLLSKYFKEEQIYRIDHYLGKEMIQGLMHFRFSNNLLESTWNHESIERIDVRLWETIGVEGRGDFYDPVGAWRDVGQNHLMEMLAFLTMDYSGKTNAEALRSAREVLLSQLRPMTLAEIKKNTVRGQYSGYQDIEGVKKNSNTETYFKIQTQLKTPRWKDVILTLESGKRMKTVKKDIEVTFRHPQVCYTCTTQEHFHNKVTFAFAPDDTIVISFLTKKPGLEKIVEERKFTFFLHEKENRRPYVEEYAKLFYDCIAGDQSLFVGRDESEILWKFADPITHAWEKNEVPLIQYTPDTNEAIQYAQEKFDVKPSNMFVREVGIVGLGKMGAGLAEQLLEKGWKVVGYNRHPEPVHELQKKGLTGAFSYEELVAKLSGPRLIWLMIPAGKAIDEVLFGTKGLLSYLRKGDIIIDGGNSFYKDTIERARKIKKQGIEFFDVGVSGGPGGARSGACLMIGGEKKLFQKYEPLFRDLALKDAYQFFPGVGAGHFVKMIHNGIEYGMMQALAEGFSILKSSSYKLNLQDVASIYNNGSVIESRLTNWLLNGLEEQGQNLEKVSGTVAHTGEGEWTVKTGKELKVPTPIVKGSFDFRVDSEKNPSYTGKILSLLRNQFGHHAMIAVQENKKAKKRKNKR